MAEVILFLFEGEKTESIISDSIMKHFLDKDTRIIKSSFKTDIYTLYSQLSEDEDLDVVFLLKERNEDLLEYRRDSFSEIYLFFDYDGHAPAACDNKIDDLLSFFDNETENGKLFISYPMVEAIKCIDKTYDEVIFCQHSLDKNLFSGFKGYVHQYACPSLIHFRGYSADLWNKVIRLHCIKANYLVTGKMLFPSSYISQQGIFRAQKDDYINSHSKVSILGSFPLMLMGYFGSDGLRDKLS